MALNYVRDKGKPQCKLSYKLLKEEYGYDTLVEIYPYPTLVQLKYFLGGIHHCVTVGGKWIFDSNFPFEITLTKENLYYCFINDNETTVTDFYKGLLRSSRVFKKYNTKIVIQK